LKIVPYLIVAFMGLTTFLAGLVLFCQERVVPIIYGGYTVERPYMAVGFMLMVFGVILMVTSLIGAAFIPLEKALKEWAERKAKA
jgi:hypothetical protein